MSPLFMFGFERSGTTLLSMMVGAHPSVAVPLSVTGLWYRYYSDLPEFGDINTDADVARLTDSLLAEERIGLWDVALDREELLRGLVPHNFGEIVRCFHAEYARHKNKTNWANLDIATLDHMDEVNTWFPDAKFIHIVRDGRDVALSHETMPYGAANTMECAERWVHRLTVNLKMGAILGNERYLVIRYEDLVLESADTLKKICDFAKIEYSPEMLKYPEMVDAKVPQDKRWLWPALDKPPVKAKAYAWKHRMSGAKRMVFESIAAEQLAELGYEVYDIVPKTLGRYLFELWCFLGKGGRFRRVAKKFHLNRPSKLERDAQSGK